jgi:hypothetical protein
VTADDFRRIVLGLKDAIEAAHMGHPDFRVNGRIFATLRADNQHGMVVLTPDQQQTFMYDHPAAFEALTLAWQNGAAKTPPARRTVKRPRPAAKKARRRKAVRRER